MVPRKVRRTASGSTLVEVLVSVVVLSVGVLGAERMQLATLQIERDARQQSAAVQFASDIAERMRSNKDVALALSDNPYLVDSSSGAAHATVDCYRQSCTDPRAMAAWEVAEWWQRASAALPGARAVVCRDAQPFAGDGTPRWDCESGAGAPMVIKIGWTRTRVLGGKTDQTTLQRAEGAKASAPMVVFPVIPGSQT